MAKEVGRLQEESMIVSGAASEHYVVLNLFKGLVKVYRIEKGDSLLLVNRIADFAGGQFARNILIVKDQYIVMGDCTGSLFWWHVNGQCPLLRIDSHQANVNFVHYNSRFNLLLSLADHSRIHIYAHS